MTCAGGDSNHFLAADPFLQYCQLRILDLHRFNITFCVCFHIGARLGLIHTHLCNKLDNLDKNIEWHVSGHDAATPFGEKSGGDGRQTTGGGRREETEDTSVKSLCVEKYCLGFCSFVGKQKTM